MDFRGHSEALKLGSQIYVLDTILETLSKKICARCAYCNTNFMTTGKTEEKKKMEMYSERANFTFHANDMMVKKSRYRRYMSLLENFQLFYRGEFVIYMLNCSST